jgi:nitroreductase
MEFKSSVIDLIKIRKSIRSYESDNLKEEDKKKIIDFIKKDHKTVFECKMRFEFIDASDLNPDDLKTLGTYGIIRGARYFIGGTIKKSDRKNYCLVDFGYVFEKIILFITDLCLGTCWLGGTFNKKGFAEKLAVKEDEIIPGISPVGIIPKKRDLRGAIIRKLAGSKNRKPWDKIFFADSFSSPLEEHISGPYREPLEMVRIAPSASNLQPWRIIREKDRDIFHFFIKKSKRYDRSSSTLNLQYIDMGISLCHFELTASELDMAGKWELKDGIQDNKKYNIPSDVDYIISWNGS